MNLSVNFTASTRNVGIKWLQQELEENDTISKKRNWNCHNVSAQVLYPRQHEKLKVRFLKSLEPWQIKNLKICNEEETGKVPCTEKVYRRFWNKQAKELSKRSLKIKSRNSVIDITKLAKTKIGGSTRRRKEFITKTADEKGRNHWKQQKKTGGSPWKFGSCFRSI